MPLRENYIEVKANNKPQPLEKIIDAKKAINGMPRGRVAVLCDPDITKEGSILVAYGKYEGSMNSDTGVVIGSTAPGFNQGDRVMFLPLHGIRCSKPNFSWVPDDCEIRFYGVACSVYDSLHVLEN